LEAFRDDALHRPSTALGWLRDISEGPENDTALCTG
jgi:hypothetical protein